MTVEEELRAALAELVTINEQHNLVIEEIIGRPLNWKDTYLDRARKILSSLSVDEYHDLKPGDKLVALETTCTFNEGNTVTYEGPGPGDEVMVHGMSWMRKRFRLA